MSVFISDKDTAKLYIHFFRSTKITPNLNISAISWSMSKIFKPFKKLAVVASPQVFKPESTLENCKVFKSSPSQTLNWDHDMFPWCQSWIPQFLKTKKERTNINAILVITKGYRVRATMAEGQNAFALYNVHVDTVSLNTFFSSKSLLIVSVVWNWCCWLLPGFLFGRK